MRKAEPPDIIRAALAAVCCRRCGGGNCPLQGINWDASELLTTYMTELEYLLEETLRIEHHCHLRKHDYEVEQEFKTQHQKTH